jgi:hypothetical protein
MLAGERDTRRETVVAHNVNNNSIDGQRVVAAAADNRTQNWCGKIMA